MPNQFGLETPQEAQARIVAAFSDTRDQLNESSLAQTQGGRLGIGIGNLFRGMVQKGSDTKKARKSEALRLAEEDGLSMEEARAVAKDNIPREFAEVRRAKEMAKGQGIAEETFAKLEPVIGTARAQAASMTVMAAQLRRNGFATEATQLTMQSLEIRQNEELRELKLADLTAELEGKQKRNDDIGESETTRLIDDIEVTREELTAQIEANDNPDEIFKLENRLEYEEGRMAMLTTRSLSDADLEQLGSRARDSVQLDILDSQLLDARFGMLEETVTNFRGDWGATTVGAIGARAASFAEGFAGVAPGSWGADELLQSVTKFKSFPAYAASQLRHALTGAAMSAQEAPMMEPFLPTPGDSITTMLGKIAAVRAYTQLDISVRRAFLEQYTGGDEFDADNKFPTSQQVPAGLRALMNANSQPVAAAPSVTNGQATINLSDKAKAAVAASMK